MRKFNRKNHEPRKISVEVDINKNADGSCIINYGMTKVICTASIDEDIPKWLREKKTGWITAEYGMLPGSTNSRNKRESKVGKQSGRTDRNTKVNWKVLKISSRLAKTNRIPNHC